ncbi:hypothetical protein OQI87_08245 [Lactobacillus kefiranofaciens]|uniref:hypothetical protein n=1 Tax=Lactobacillus kefiranofaciens TaxID=267818 RepID=UPI00246988B2|nr:hypothetical protein [Lactobacillus kefiranofaciens]MDH5101078.1 hypothetical protein [Lactobacillus kefiranofaciens]
MKTKKLFTSLAAAVMLSAGLAGSGVAMTAEPVHAATAQTAKKGTVSLKRRSVKATINVDKPKIYVVSQDGKSIKSQDSTYTKGQVVPVYWSTEATSSNGQSSNSLTLYYVENKTIDGKDCMIFLSAADVTTANAVPPTLENFQKQVKADTEAVQATYKNRELKYIVVTPKSKKGAKIYYAYKKSKKSKKIYFKATKKKIKKGKKYKTSMIVKHGKTRYVYIGKKRYVKSTAVKTVSVKYAPVKLPADLKNLVVEN